MSFFENIQHSWRSHIQWLLLIAFPFFFIGGPNYASGPLFRALWDLGHPAFFFGLVIWLHRFYPFNRWRNALILIAAVALLGGAIEVIQAHVGRDGNWRDLIRDLTGTLIGLFWVQSPSKWIWLGRVLVMALLLPDLHRVAMEASIKTYKQIKFPMIDGFESRLELYGLGGHVALTNTWKTEGNTALLIKLNTDQYSGVTLRRISRDWRSYKNLSFDIFNPGDQSLDMTFRVNDALHDSMGSRYSDRFNQRITLLPGENHFNIPIERIVKAPAERVMDLSEINCIVLFATRLKDPQIIYLDNLRLE